MDTPQANWLPCLLSSVRTRLLDAFIGGPPTEAADQSGSHSFFQRWCGWRPMLGSQVQPEQETNGAATSKGKEARVLQEEKNVEPTINPEDPGSQSDTSTDTQTPEATVMCEGGEATRPSSYGERKARAQNSAGDDFKAGDHVSSETVGRFRGRKRKQEAMQNKPAKLQSVPSNPSLNGARQQKLHSSRCPWLPTLHLSMEHKEILESQDWLDDKLIDAAQQLLKKQYGAEGLQTTLLSCCKDGFQPIGSPGVQIHFDAGREHWFTSCRQGDCVEVADSLGPKCLTLESQKQLVQCYGELAQDGRLKVHLLKADCQPNWDDCGLYAIANAVEFLVPKGDPTSAYQNHLMRPHLTACLEKGKLTPFPKNLKQRQSLPKKSKTQVVHVP